MKSKLLGCGISCQILGREMWRPLVSLAKKILPDSGTQEAFEVAIRSWLAEETEKHSDKESTLEILTDRANSLLGILNYCPGPTLREVVSRIKEIFEETTSQLILSTGHGAKGLEFDCVIHLDPWRIPSIFAKSAENFQQEENILNVIETRTKQYLILANVADFMGV
jgi:superfamily I DNA/RNA helicase